MAYVSTTAAAGGVTGITLPQSTVSSSQLHQPSATLPSVFVSTNYFVIHFYEALSLRATLCIHSVRPFRPTVTELKS